MRTEDAIKRLALIKHLYSLAVDQSYKPEPTCASAVLLFHDSIELFLELASEHLDKGKSGRNFMEYWDLLRPDLPNGGLTQKESVRQLNTARVGLKHSGICPSKLALEGFRATATNFFKENTPIVFGIEFSDVSLIELVECEETKESLIEAQELLKSGKIEDSLDKIAIAFSQLIDDYEHRKKDQYGRSPFFFGRDMTFLSSSFLNLFRTDLGDFVDAIKESIEAIQDSIKILSLGLDHRKYARFRLLTPVIERIPRASPKERYRVQRTDKVETAPEDVDFCIKFVIESALILQDFDYEIKFRKHPTLADRF